MTTFTNNVPYLVVTFPLSPIQLTGAPCSVATPVAQNLESISLFPLHKDFRVGPWRLNSLLLAEVHIAQDSVIALTYLNQTSEYGSGQTPEAALCDLVSSLGEYREALESRRDRLGLSAIGDLAVLENLIARVTTQ
ncbi:MAG: hypothetical protein HYU30_07065 [Chloroflexi bacterium]|nr:hypothetical protein [Chloroflexota bacterium]